MRTSHAIATILPEEIFHLAIESCPVGILMTDSAGAIVLVNAEMERLFGYSRAEMVGRSVDILVPEKLRGQHARQRQHFAAHPVSRAAAGRNLAGQRKDGSEFLIEIGFNPIRSGENMLVLGVVVDLSERKRIERQKNEFVATVSHELRTPLTSIAGALGLLVNGPEKSLPGATMRLLTIAHANCQRLVRLVNSILDMEKIESGKVVFVLKRIEIRALVGQAIESNQEFAKGHNVRLRLDAAAERGELRGDSDWLMQVFTNLLANAVKFSPPGEEVAVGIEQRDGNIRVSVRDRGRGIPEEFKSRIFEKFAQADASDARKEGGAGLGLSIVKQIVTRLGGQVSFDNAPGGGAIFYVEFPACEPETATAAEFAAMPLVSVPSPNTCPVCSDD